MLSPTAEIPHTQRGGAGGIDVAESRDEGEGLFRLTDRLGQLCDGTEPDTGLQARLDVMLEESTQEGLERLHPLDQLGVGQRAHVRPISTDLVDLVAIGVVGGEVGRAENLLGEPRAGLGSYSGGLWSKSRFSLS